MHLTISACRKPLHNTSIFRFHKARTRTCIWHEFEHRYHVWRLIQSSPIAQHRLIPNRTCMFKSQMHAFEVPPVHFKMNIEENNFVSKNVYIEMHVRQQIADKNITRTRLKPYKNNMKGKNKTICQAANVLLQETLLHI